MSVIDELYDYAHDHRILLSLTIELTTLCNEQCIHCYIPNHDNKGMDIETVKRAIKEFRDLGGLNLTLTGGEIFLRKDIFEIIEYARSLHIRFFLLTNATLLTEENVKKLKKLNIAELSISVYSLENHIHDYITNREGSCEKTLNAIDMAIRNGISVTVKTPLIEKNKYSYKDLKKYCFDKKINYIASCIIFSKSDGDSSVKDLIINENDKKNIAKDVEKMEPNGRRNYYDEACGSLKCTLAIDASGNVFPCNSFYYKLGNVYSNTLEEIWNSMALKNIQEIRKNELSECTSCVYKKRCSRCPGLAYLEDNTLYGCSSTARENVQSMVCYQCNQGACNGK